MEKIDVVQILENRIGQCIKLSVNQEKYDNAMEMIKRSADDLLRINFVNEGHATKNFKNFVNKSLSTIEVLGLDERQYKACRKLCQNEIYSALDLILAEMKGKKERVVKVSQKEV